MMCFRDRTFCSATCLNASCSRRWSDDLQKQADEWAKRSNLRETPVAFSDFSEGCPGHFDSVTQSPTGQVVVSSDDVVLYTGRPTMDGAADGS